MLLTLLTLCNCHFFFHPLICNYKGGKDKPNKSNKQTKKNLALGHLTKIGPRSPYISANRHHNHTKTKPS